MILMNLKSDAKIVFNEFNINPSINIEGQVQTLKEDMLQIEFPNGYLLDVGWRPSFDINGHFYVYLIKDFNWESPQLIVEVDNVKSLIVEVNKAIQLVYVD